MPDAADLPVVVALGSVHPDQVDPVLGGHCRFVPEPTDSDLAVAQGAIVRADALVDNEFLARTPRLRVLARTAGILGDLEAAICRELGADRSRRRPSPGGNTG